MINEKRIVIETILYDGVVDGIMQIISTNFNGTCFKIPRNKVCNCNAIKEFIECPAVYILIGKENDKFIYYIGEADNCLHRIKQHLKETEDYWNTALLFIGENNHPLDKALVKDLESKMYRLAIEKQKNTFFEIKNRNCPNGAHLSPAQEIKSNSFFEGIIIICNTLGLNLYEEDTKEKVDESDSELYFFKILKNGIEAKGYRVNQGFLVLKGSSCAKQMEDYTTECFIKEREKLIKEGVIEDGVFKKDYTFSSSSAAAVQVCGHNKSGPRAWKTSTGLTLKEIQENEMK